VNDGKREAKVTMTRMEERAPGEGVPAGWLPEVRYVWTAENIPKGRSQFVIEARLKEEYYLRQLLVTSVPCELKIEIGSRTVLPRSPSMLMGQISILPWPPKPLLLKIHEPIKITIFPKSDMTELPETFSCTLRGGAKRVLS
jgi:hypothetical protein